MKTIILILLLIFISLALPKNSLAHTGTYEIRITKDGFSPSLLTILQGDTVKFINAGKELHWPASDIHPTHQIYPEFDPKKGIAPGQSWSFTFSRVGSWRMHDHLFPENLGRITVDSDPNYINLTSPNPKPSWQQQILQQVNDLQIAFLQKYYSLFPTAQTAALSRFNIQRVATSSDNDKIRYYLKLFGSKTIMDKLVVDSGGGSIVDCHQEAHRIGRVAYELYGAKVFQLGNFDCHSGFIHGAMEAFLRDKGTDNLAFNIEELCNAFPTSYGNFECLHGVGHGVMAYASYDLPGALDTCKQLSTEFEQSSCYGGVFMENIVTAEGNGAGSAHSTSWVSSDPQFPCNAVTTDIDVQVQCYLMQTSRMLDISGFDFDFVSKNCLNAPENLIATCYQSEGRDAAGQTLRNPQKIIYICNKVVKDHYHDCISGALNVIVEFWSDKMADKPHQLCKLVKDPETKLTCYSLLASRLSGIYGTNTKLITQSCAYFEPDYQSMCRSLNHV